MSNTITTNDECIVFLERFNQFYDSVFRSISLRFLPDGTQTIDLEASVQDAFVEDVDDGWVCIVITVEMVKETHIAKKPKTSIQVLSQGIHITTYDELIGLEFGGALDPPATLEELRQSEAYALGKKLSFEVFSYERV